MQVIHITSINDLDLIEGQKMQMALAHLVLRHPHYAEFMQKQKGYKILDNSVIELGNSMSFSEMLQAANFIGADEIILPDELFDRVTTLCLIEGALEIYTTFHLQQNIMCVAAGKNYDEILECIIDICRLVERYKIPTEKVVIGIPKYATDFNPRGRLPYIQAFEGTHIVFHLLGLKYSFTELYDLMKYKNIRSVDTCQLSYVLSHDLGYLAVRPSGHTINLEHTQLSSNNRILFRRCVDAINSGKICESNLS